MNQSAQHKKPTQPQMDHVAPRRFNQLSILSNGMVLTIVISFLVWWLSRQESIVIVGTLSTMFVIHLCEFKYSLQNIRKVHRFWGLAAWIIPSNSRKNEFEPAYEDLKHEHVLARQRYRGKLARRWLMFCFNIHAFVLIIQSLRVWAWAKVAIWVKGIASIFSW